MYCDLKQNNVKNNQIFFLSFFLAQPAIIFLSVAKRNNKCVSVIRADRK